MKLRLCGISLFGCAALLLAAAPVAHAQISSATVYLGTPDANNAGDSANWGSSLKSAQFNIGSLGIDFQSNGNYDVNDFLNNPTYFNPQNGFTSALAGATGSLDNSELVITGQAFLNAGNNSFVVGHDDGVVLTFTSLPGGFGNGVDDPGPTGFTSTPFNFNNPDGSGLYAFTLDYAECCGAPADLEFTVNGAPITGNATPEPSSFALLGTGMLAFANMARRRFVA